MDYLVKHEQMLCGSYEAEVRKYNKYIDTSGKIWLVADQPNKADNIYVQGGVNSDGFGGRELSFTLVDDTVIKLKGPWHTNSEALYSATGVDVRDTHLTFGCVSRARDYEGNKTNMVDVIYIDEQPTLGLFQRIANIAKNLVNKHKCTLYTYTQSQSGSSCGPVNYDV